MLRRFYGTYAHHRDIRCLFKNNLAKYSIPIFHDQERKAFGYVLDIEVDLDAPEQTLTLKKRERVSGCCGEKKELWKSVYQTPTLLLE